MYYNPSIVLLFYVCVACTICRRAWILLHNGKHAHTFNVRMQMNEYNNWLFTSGHKLLNIGSGADMFPLQYGTKDHA